MLRVFLPSGREFNAVPVEDLSDVRTFKEHLHVVSGYSRFRQRLLHDGAILDDSYALDAPLDLQLVLLPFSNTARSSVLIEAASRGDALEIEQILQTPQNPNMGRTREGFTALMCASTAGHREVADLLIQAGAEIDHEDFFRGTTALMCACGAGQAEVARLLLDARADVDLQDRVGHTALLIATGEGHEDVVHVLLEAGADPNLADLGRGYTPLICAAVKGLTKAVRLLLKAGADMEVADRKGFTALMRASGAGRTAVVRLLLKAEANPDAATASRFTALMCACSEGRTDAARLLLEAGADKDVAAPGSELGNSFAFFRGLGAQLLCCVSGEAPTSRLHKARRADVGVKCVRRSTVTIKHPGIAWIHGLCLCQERSA